MDTGPDVLRRYRRRANLTQQELSVELGRHASSVSQWERGIQRPTRESAQALDDRLDADGEIVSAFGFAIAEEASTRRDELDGLRSRLRSVEQRLAEQAEDHAERWGAMNDLIEDLVLRLERVERLTG